MRQNDDLEADGVQRVLAFWDRIFTHYGQKEILTSEDKLVLSNSSKMSVYLKDIGAESLEWLKLSARYVDVGHDSPTLIEQLDRLADTSPKEVGDVYVDMLDNDVFPMYEMKHVESSVEKLYLAGLLDAANVICNLYLEKGFENLRSLFRKYNENDL